MRPTPATTSVLLVTRNFPPRQGGMERLNWHIADELAKRCAIRVIAPERASDSNLPSKVRVTGARLSPLPFFLADAARQALSIARQWRPDIVLAGSGLTAPIAWLAARSCGAKAFAYVHGLDITAPHPVYHTLWLPFLRKMNRVIANSHATAALATNMGVPAECIRIVHPGVSIPEIDPSARERFRAAHGFGDRPLLLSVGRLTQRKGLLEFITYCLPIIVKAYPDCLFLIVGEVPKHALQRAPVNPEAIHTAAQEVGVAKNIHFLGSPDDGELSQIYQAVDVHVFPVQQLPNNPEGFGMVAVESAAHGTPTVAFAVGGVPDAIQEGVSGALLPAGEYAKFAQAVISYLNYGNMTGISNECRDFANRFSWERFGGSLWETCF